MSARYIHPLRVTALLLLLASMISACSPIQPLGTTASSVNASSAPAPTASAAAGTSPPASTEASTAATASEASTAAGIDEQAITRGIQETLDLYAHAYNKQDPSLFTQVVDPANSSIMRYVRTRFDYEQQSVFQGGEYALSVRSIKQRPLGFVMAEVERYGWVVNWTFREVDGRWLMSEPIEKQLGDRKKVETEHFTFHVYDWTEEVNPQIMQMMEVARAKALETLGKVPDEKPDVYIKPTFGVGQLTGPLIQGYYMRGRKADKMIIASPYSYPFVGYDPATGWEKELQETITHEYAHLVNDRMFTPTFRMSDWMAEGLAEYVANPKSVVDSGAAIAARAGHIIPLMDPSARVNKQDLQHMDILEQDRALAYGFAASVVDFIVAKYGGLDGFWKLVQVYDKKQALPESLQEAFGVSYEQFDQEWRAWLAENY